MTHTPSQKTRIDTRFADLKAQGKKAFIAYVTGGDPDAKTSLEIIKGLPAAGADVIEIGMPFSDPMADGPAIQAAGLRALNAGATMIKTLDLVRGFRAEDNTTPIVLMGYYNPIYAYGVDRFLVDCKEAGVDGFIVVDLPAEEDEEFCIPALEAGLNFIRLVPPTADAKRLPAVLENTSGFVYHVSVTGITGAASAQAEAVAAAVQKIKGSTELPVSIGFGIKTPDQARDMASVADGAVVGTALVDCIYRTLDADGRPTDETVTKVLALAADLAAGAHAA